MAFSRLQRTLQTRGYWSEAGGDGEGSVGGSEPSAEAIAAQVKAEALAEAEALATKDKDASKISDKEADLLKEVMKHKTKSKETEAALLALKSEFSKFEGINLDEVKELLNQKKDSDTKKLEDQGQWDLLKKQMAEENQKLVKVHADRSSELQALVDLQQSKIDKLTLGHTFNTSPFILNELNLSSEKTRIIYGSHFELQGDQIVAYDKPKGTDSRVQLVDASGDALSFEESMRKIVESDADKDRLIKSKIKQGSGSGTTGTRIDLSNAVPLKGMDRISKALEAQKK